MPKKKYPNRGRYPIMVTFAVSQAMLDKIQQRKEELNYPSESEYLRNLVRFGIEKDLPYTPPSDL